MRRFAGLVPFVLIFVLALPAGAAAPTPRYALSGEARAIEVALGDQGVTLGLALSRADSTPTALGVGAGQCALLGDEADPDDLPCTESTTQKSTYPGKAAPAAEVCAGPAIPAPLNTVLSVKVACGSSVTGVTGGYPYSTNAGKVADIALNADLTGLVPQLEEVKELVIDELQDLLNQAPEPIKNALNQITDALDEGQAVKISVGPSTSNIARKGDLLSVTSSAAGARIGVLGIPDLDKNGVPIPGSSVATEDGLLIVEVGPATASATVNTSNAAATSAASTTLATIKVRDITQPKPTYIEIPVPVGQSVTVLPGTPAESTVTVAGATQESEKGSARAAADAVSVHLLKGVQGGVRAGIGRATAAASIDVVSPKSPPKAKPPTTLPVTGGRDLSAIAFTLLAGAALLLAVRKRFFI